MGRLDNAGRRNRGDARIRLEPIAAALLVVALALAILTEGIVPSLWTKALLVASLPLDVVTALWLTRH